MRFLDSLRFRLAALLHRSEMNAEVDDELRSHIQLRADDLERSGLSRAQAERRARIEFGAKPRFEEECREASGGAFLDSVLMDLRFALRMLRKSPGFTLVAVGTLALAIGANAVVFGVLNALVLRPLNVPDPDSFYSIERVSDFSARQSYPDYVDLRDRNRSFDDLAAYNIEMAGLDTGANPARVWVYEVSGNYFDALRIQPFLGRVFHASEERGANSAPYIVLSHAYWHSHFHDDPGVVGRAVRVNKHPFTIVGVTPPGFYGTLIFGNPDFFVPMVQQEQVEGRNDMEARGVRWVFMTMGHLKPGLTPEQAAADINSIGAYLEKTYPDSHAQMRFALARPSLYGDYFGRPLRAFLTGLMLLAGLILVAACANLGSLFAARAADRSREVALRLALGSSRARILRQLFTEALLLSLLGGAAGLWGSVALLRWLTAWQPFPQFPMHVSLNPDASVYVVAAFLAVASGLLFGAVPVRQVLRTDPYEIVKSGTTGAAGRRLTVRDLLLVAQIAICAVLVTSSFVALRGMARSLHSNFGFNPENTIVLDTVLDMAGYRGEAVPIMQKRMIEAMETIPGVDAVGMVDWVPLSNGSAHGALIYTDETTDLRPSNAAFTGMRYSISPDYFRAAATTMLAGRAFSWHDDENAPRVAVVNREFAGRLFGSVPNALSRYFKDRDGNRVQVVGVVEDGKYVSLTEDPEAAAFLPIRQQPSSESSLVVRSSRDPQQLAAAMKDELRLLDAGLPLYIQTWNNKLDLALFPSRVATVSLGVLGLMGAMLSITGIFGLAAYSVGRRLRELGIRMALGAQRSEVLQAALARPFKLLAFGSVAGLALGLLATRLLAVIVYHATPRDPLVLAGVVLAMAFVGLIATWLPAQRALSVDPLILLREE